MLPESGLYGQNIDVFKNGIYKKTNAIDVACSDARILTRTIKKGGDETLVFAMLLFPRFKLTCFVLLCLPRHKRNVRH
jgi:hypothetical protein